MRLWTQLDVLNMVGGKQQKVRRVEQTVFYLFSTTGNAQYICEAAQWSKMVRIQIQRNAIDGVVIPSRYR